MELPSYLKSINDILVPMAPMAPMTLQISATSLATTLTTPLTTSSTNKDKKLKFMLVSTHAHQYTGYSKVSYHILQELAKHPWLSLTHFGFQKHPQASTTFRPYPTNVDVIDAVSLENPIQQGFGYQAITEVIKKKEPDIVMIYNDMSVVTRFLEEIRKSSVTRKFKIWIYCDQVYDCQMQGMIDILNRDADRVFAFTNYWKQQLKDQGVTRPLSILGHGFDPKTFFTVPRELARKSLKLPEDAFVIMNLNRNQPRKRYDILIMAFTELVVKYPTRPILLLCICDKGEKGGWWLFELYVRELRKRGVSIEQFGNRLMISSQDMAFSDEDVNVLYNIADVGISTAEGEGWGLCNFEQMGVGIPQVVPDIGGYKEFCNRDNSALVKPKYRYYLPGVYSPVGGEAHVCDPHDVCLAMEDYVNDSERCKTHGKKAKETVLSYTWEKAVGGLVKSLKAQHEDDE